MRILLRLVSRVRPLALVGRPISEPFSRFKSAKGPSPVTDKVFMGKIAAGAILTSMLGIGAYKFLSRPSEKKPCTGGATIIGSTTTEEDIGNIRADLPYYTMDDLEKHKSIEDRVWMTYKNGVYDVTDYVDGHPGGDQITMAGGRELEPFWNVYTMHKNGETYDVLESLRIGNIKQCVKTFADPYGSEPVRDSRMETILAKPYNGQAPMALLVESWITPNGLHYVRNHLPVPQIDPDKWKLTIEVEGLDSPFTFTLDELKQMPKHSVTSTLMCNGNRRFEMGDATGKPAKPPIWRAGAMSNATWSGVKLADLLHKCGVSEEDAGVCYNHVQFEQYEPVGDTGITFGASIFFKRAIDPSNEVLVAYEMNGEPLPPDHGYPARILAPGIAGARNIKWLGKIIVSANESPCYWQQRVYKGYGPSEGWGNVDYNRALAIQELPVQSAICTPGINEQVCVDKDGFITVRGYAYSGGGQKIIRVDVTADGGDTWHIAELDRQDMERIQPHHWSWTLWKAKIPVPKNAKNVEIWAKAVDSSHNTQPEGWKNIFNFRGVICNAYHRVPVTLK